jgi:DNA-binding beta-propeller fold protein YncE
MQLNRTGFEDYETSTIISSSDLWQPQGMSGIALAGHIALVADTQNQVIRKIDFLSDGPSTSIIAGNLTVKGNCLDGSCPPNSFRDGVGAEATFTMPYSVRFDHTRKHALVADTRSSAIRQINLYTFQVTTLLRDVGFPTDIAVLPQGIFFFCDAMNHVIRRSDGKIISGSFSRGYAEGPASSAKFSDPLSITYNPNEDKLYVADYTNRVIREVDPITGFTVLRIGDPSSSSSSSSIKDSPSVPIILSGPTSLVYFQGMCVCIYMRTGQTHLTHTHTNTGTNAVYFSDRNVESDDAVLRVWYVSTNTVFTIVGQESRVLQTADGSVLDPSVGLNAIWGVTVLSPDWIAWSEADTNLIRAVSRKPLCKVGEHYDDEEEGQCIPCDPASKPHGTTFINNIDCAWACPDPPHQYLPFVCPEFQSPPVRNAKLAVGEGGTTGITVVCDAGYEKTSSEYTCELCPAGYYCDGTNTGKKPCQENSHSLPGATSQHEGCICNPSFYYDNGTCAPCPINHYCPGSKEGPIQCPSGTTSNNNTTTSTSIDNCTCHNGSLSGYECTVCTYLPPLAKYVSSDPKIVREDCKWVCPKGYHRVGDYFENGYCTPCTFQGPCDTPGEYVSYDDGACGVLQDGQSDHICLPCRNDKNAIFTSRNNCSAWECKKGFFFDPFWDKCVPCDTRKYSCPQGQHRAKCTTHSDSVCVPCPGGGGGGFTGGFLAADTCDLVCYNGWERLPNKDKKKCCSDNSIHVGITNNGTARDCVCSSGFRIVEQGSICV